MTDRDLQHLRREKWRTDGRPVRTPMEAGDWVESVGLCLLLPPRTPLVLPTFLGAFVGDDRALPAARQASSDPRVHEAEELVLWLVRQHNAVESNAIADSRLVVALSVLPFFYALVAERSPKREQLSQLASDAFAEIEHAGPITVPRLQMRLGKEVSIAAIDRALGELWLRMRIVPVDHEPQGAAWNSLARWAPEAVREGERLSLPAALSGLISKYIDAVVAAEPQEIEKVFSHLAPRSRVKESMNALLAARELSFVQVGRHSLLQITPARSAPTPRTLRPQRATRYNRTPR